MNLDNSDKNLKKNSKYQNQDQIKQWKLDSGSSTSI
jgi:hypothetical protein